MTAADLPDVGAWTRFAFAVVIAALILSVDGWIRAYLGKRAAEAEVKLLREQVETIMRVSSEGIATLVATAQKEIEKAVVRGSPLHHLVSVKPHLAGQAPTEGPCALCSDKGGPPCDPAAACEFCCIGIYSECATCGRVGLREDVRLKDLAP